MGAAKPRAGNKAHARAHKKEKKQTKNRTSSKTLDEPPEDTEGDASNSLFGSTKKQKSSASGAKEQSGGATAPPAQKRGRSEPLREDPAAAAMRAQKKAKKAEDKSSGGGAAPGRSPPAAKPQPNVKPHADAVEKSNQLWERLRSDKTPVAEREALVGEVLALFEGKLLSVLNKHDAARVLQSCFKLGTSAQREALVAEIIGQARALARSHYGHFLLISILRHGTPSHKQRLLAELCPHAAELLVHAEGSAVLQLLYQDVATATQRNGMYRALWGKEIALLHDDRTVGPGSDGQVPTSLSQLFESDPLCRTRVLRRLEVLLSKAARKGLALTALVQRAGAELLEHGEPAQKAELVGSLREQAVHMMHTRDGARIACGCLRYGDAKDRKVLLKALKGFGSKAAVDANGTLVLCTALEVVDDTVLVSKGPLAEMLAELPELVSHAHGALPLLQLLAPREKRYFTPEQLGILGPAEPEANTASKKDPAVRRAELLKASLPPLLAHLAEHAAPLARTHTGGAVLFEACKVAAEEVTRDAAGDAAGAGGVDPAAASAGRAKLVSALASAAADVADGQAALVADPYGARLFKRMVQADDEFADALASALDGELAKYAKQGAGWVVLALLESEKTGGRVRNELKGAAAALGKSSAAGCRSLADVLGKKGVGSTVAAAKPAAKPAAPKAAKAKKKAA